MSLFGISLESSGDFSMRCQCLISNLVRRCVGRCSEYVVVKVRRSTPACGLLAWVFLSVKECNSSNALIYGLLIVCILIFFHIFDMLLFVCLECSFIQVCLEVSE